MGTKLSLELPVTADGGIGVEILTCGPLWGYECAVKGSDLIIGYPFLKNFSLVVDCPTDTLRSTPTSTSRVRSTTSKIVTPTTFSKQTPSVFYREAPKVSKASCVSPVSKMNDPGPSKFRGISSYPAAHEYRFPPARPQAGLAVHLPQVRSIPQHPPTAP